MDSPKIFARKPKVMSLTAGTSYEWCTCGKASADAQPFCDDSHAGTKFIPKQFAPEKDRKAAICMCKNTQNPPYCDGTHRKLKD